jgi:hypothetical protein
MCLKPKEDKELKAQGYALAVIGFVLLCFLLLSVWQILSAQEMDIATSIIETGGR